VLLSNIDQIRQRSYRYASYNQIWQREGARCSLRRSLPAGTGSKCQLMQGSTCNSGRGHFCYVDLTEISLRLVRTILERAGYKVDVAENMEQARRQWSRQTGNMWHSSPAILFLSISKPLSKGSHRLRKFPFTG
jgi:hypothetical protein